MEQEIRTRSTQRLVWGLFLIVLGGVFLLDRLGVIWMPSIGELWPAVFYVVGINHLLARRPGSAIMFFLMGTWFFACTFEWMGLTYRNSWGLLLVAVGLGMVARALSGEEPRRRLARDREAPRD